jgi:5-methylcytosine-specific restriction endonuclease McrA
MSKSQIPVKLKRAVFRRAKGRCEYCRSQVAFSPDTFSIEHIIPRALGGTDDLDNLALACQRCNNLKHTFVEAKDPVTGNTVPLFHPRRDRWSNHFAWSSDYRLVNGLTPTGRATIERLDLNREGVVNMRRVLRMAGEHPLAEND